MPKPKWLEPLEQFGHVWLGIGCALLCLDLVYWLRERRWQWPPGQRATLTRSNGAVETYVPENRVIDMMTDLKHCIIGSTIVNVAKTTAIIILAALLWMKS